MQFDHVIYLRTIAQLLLKSAIYLMKKKKALLWIVDSKVWVKIWAINNNLSPSFFLIKLYIF